MTDKKQTKKPEEKPKVETDKKEHIARAKSPNAPISKKISREIAAFIRNRTTTQALALLEKVLDKKIAVPYKRYNTDVGHKPGKIAAGRYPEKATKEFIKLIKLVEAHADNKGLDSKNLIIFDVRANQGEGILHYGRQRGIQMKRTNLEIGVKEK